MKKIYGGFRLGMAVLMILLAVIGVTITRLFPFRYRGVPLTTWSVFVVIRLICFSFRIKVRCSDAKLMRSYGGLIFPNHLSVLDILVLYYCTPVRFLAAHDVGERPGIGWIARSVGTVFVNRDSPRSRVAARDQVADALNASDVPPIVLFPEGRLGPGDTLFPFRHGAFGIAIQGGFPFMPCAIRYDPLELVVWRAAAEGEGMWSSIWRMAQYTGRVDVDVMPLEVVQPGPDDNSRELARKTRRDMADALGLPLDEEAVVARTGLRPIVPPTTPS